MKNKETEKLRKYAEELNSRDKVGLMGEGIATAAGATAGLAGSTAIASTAGATSTVFLGSSTLGGLLGIGTVVTPIGWVIGSAVAGTALAYGVSQLIRSGGRHDRIREEIKQDIETEIERRSEMEISPQQIQILESILEKASEMGRVNDDTKQRLLNAVKNGDMNFRAAKIRALLLIANKPGQ